MKSVISKVRFWLKNNTVLWIVGLVGFAGLHLLFALRTQIYFSQDDFAVLLHFKTHTTWQTIIQFLTVGDMWSFHKILGYINLKLIYNLFDINPLAYIINNHILHTLNVLLVFGLVRKYTGDLVKAGLSGILANSLYLHYFSNVHEYLVTSLVLLTGLYPSWLLFFMALLTKEIGLTVPFFLLGLGHTWKSLRTFWVVIGVYLVYQFTFFVSRFTLDSTHPYLVSLSRTGEIPIAILAVLLGWISIVNKNRLVWLIAAIVVAIGPSLLLVNRVETYYWYLPVMFLAILTGLLLPKLTFKTAIIYAAVILAWGGRAILPPIAKIVYPNWQKVSINYVVDLTSQYLSNHPTEATITFDSDKLERDAHLLLGSQVIDLFLPNNLTTSYRYFYDISSQTLYATAAASL